MKKLLLLFILIAVLLSASSVFALDVETSSFYCESGEIIKTGDTKAQTLTKECKPISKDVVAVNYSHTQYRDRRNTTETVIESWIYKGRNGFLYNVKFSGNTIIKITNEGR